MRPIVLPHHGAPELLLQVQPPRGHRELLLLAPPGQQVAGLSMLKVLDTIDEGLS